MTVIHIASTLTGGAGIGLWRYHQALRDCGIDSRILVMELPASGPSPEVSKFNWRKHSLPFRLCQRLGWVQTEEKRLLQKIATLDEGAGPASYELFSLPFSDYTPEDHPWIAEADIINLHWVAGALDWPRFFSVVRKPVVVTLHDQQPYLGGFHYTRDRTANPHLASMEAKIATIKMRALQGHQIGVVANSRWNAQEARASGFFPSGTPIETIYYPLDTAVFHPRSKNEAKFALGIDAGCKVIGFACENLNNKRKGFSDLLDALARLPAPLRTQVTLLSFGRDPSPELRAQVTLPWTHLGFLDTDAAKVSAYAAMDVFVAPSLAEAFGLTALEAQAVGIPVVSTRIDGLAEAVAHDEPSPAPTAPASDLIRDEIIRVLTDEAVSHRRAEAGRQLAVQRHSPSLIGLQLKAFLQKVAA